jgi:hypothetical protein
VANIHSSGRWAGLALAVATGAAGACVDNVSVSKLEIFLRDGVQIAGTPEAGSPPSDTHYEIYIVKDESTFKIAELDILPVIRRADPCFIEEEGSQFAGLHSTRIVDKMREAALADGTVSDIEAGDIATAKVRAGNMLSLESALKVMAMHEPGLTDAEIAGRLASVPSPDLIDDATNAERLAACQQIWKDHPGYYVGTDKILTIPLNGAYIGLVEGMDPRSGSLLGGGAINVDSSFPGFDAVRVNWQFNAADDPRRASYPASDIGWHYMSGPAVQRVRGVYNITVVNQDFGRRISGEISIYTDLGRDDVHF